VRGEARVVAVGIGVPDVHLGPAERRPVEVTDLTVQHQRRALLVRPMRQLARRRQPRLAPEVVRPFDRSLRAALRGGRDLFHDVLDEHVHEQRPLADLTDLHQPRLRGLELGVRHVVLADRGVYALEHGSHHRTDALR
jgi:hypothetical protein